MLCNVVDYWFVQRKQLSCQVLGRANREGLMLGFWEYRSQRWDRKRRQLALERRTSSTSPLLPFSISIFLPRFQFRLYKCLKSSYLLLSSLLLCFSLSFYYFSISIALQVRPINPDKCLLVYSSNTIKNFLHPIYFNFF